MNAGLSSRGLPAYLVHTSNPSVPNHSTAPAPAFLLVHALGLLGTASHWTLRHRRHRGISSHPGHGLGFAQHSQARQSV